jgi:hypothetical protein
VLHGGVLPAVGWMGLAHSCQLAHWGMLFLPLARSRVLKAKTCGNTSCQGVLCDVIRACEMQRYLVLCQGAVSSLTCTAVLPCRLVHRPLTIL